MGEEGPGAGPRAKGFSHAPRLGWGPTPGQGSGRLREALQASRRQAIPLTLSPQAAGLQGRPLAILSQMCLSSLLSLVAPPWHPPPPSILSGKLCQERKEVGGRAGGIQGALLG